ncbi:MAG: hypothetical protein K2Q20_06020, partial [Phycisphaerales bacterium]|nr:hypothetical protein [Phycisphaerales bacterium]
MKIAIVSTISGLSWGGSEELWAAAARRALDRGHGVLASMGRAHQPPSPKLARLTGTGMGFVERRRSLLGRLDRAMAARGVPLRFGFLRSYKPDVVLVSQCAGYDLAQNADVNELRHWLLASGTPFVVLVQWNAPVATIGEPLRPMARAYLEAAGAVLYVSERNMLDARRHLCSPLPRARVVRKTRGRLIIRPYRPWAYWR